MSRTHVHKPLKFAVPEEDIVYTKYKGHFWIKNWKDNYNKHFSRIPAEKKLRKRLNKRERTIMRDSLLNMRFDEELYDDFVPPTKIYTMYYLN